MPASAGRWQFLVPHLAMTGDILALPMPQQGLHRLTKGGTSPAEAGQDVTTACEGARAALGLSKPKPLHPGDSGEDQEWEVPRTGLGVQQPLSCPTVG